MLNLCLLLFQLPKYDGLFIYLFILGNQYIYIYIIAEAERNWIPTIKEVVTNRKKRPL